MACNWKHWNTNCSRDLYYRHQEKAKYSNCPTDCIVLLYSFQHSRSTATCAAALGLNNVCQMVCTVGLHRMIHSMWYTYNVRTGILPLAQSCILHAVYTERSKHTNKHTVFADALVCNLLSLTRLKKLLCKNSNKRYSLNTVPDTGGSWDELQN